MPFVWRRGGVYQFRRRLPKKLTELGAPALLCLSLRTEVLPEAMKRAAAIIAAVERIEAEVTTNPVRMITPAAMALIVREAARAALDEIVRRDAVAQVRTEAEADAARAGLEQEIARLRSALRLRNGELARDATRQAMSALQIPGNGDAPALVEREVLGTLLDVKTAELSYEDGTTLEHATRDLRARLFPEQTVAQIAPPVMLSAAIAAAHRSAVSLDMARKVEGTGKCMLAFRGDMPLELFLEKENFLAFLLWLRRLPKSHGKNHKRNKYSKTGIEPDKHVAIAEADEEDRKIIDEIRSRTDIDLRAKRAELAERLKPRLTDAAVEHHHARVSAIARSANDDLGWTGPAFVSVLPEFRRRAAAADNRNPDPLALRVTDEKKRSVWSLEGISDLFTSSIYTGCFSEHRRWRPGITIIRDGLYWLPLIQFTVGPRPEEAAALRKDSVRLRDGILCFAFEMRPDARQKNKASERLVPVPELLLRLGFAEWWREQLVLPGDLLFPELPASATDGKLSDLFGKSRGRIFEHLGLRDAEEDFYAGRMTVATEFLALGAPDHVRQSILGHEHGSVINRHYTQANLELMKYYVDQIDLGLIVELRGRCRFPMIRGCALLEEKALRVSLTLDEANQPTCIEVREPDRGVSHRILAERPVNPKDRASVAENLDRMGRRLASLTAGRRYRIEGVVDMTVHRVLEVLLAVAFVGAPTAAAAPDPVSAGASHNGTTSPGRKPARPAPRSRLQAFGRSPAGMVTFAAEPIQEMLGAGP